MVDVEHRLNWVFKVTVGWTLAEVTGPDFACLDSYYAILEIKLSIAAHTLGLFRILIDCHNSLDWHFSLLDILIRCNSRIVH